MLRRSKRYSQITQLSFSKGPIVKPSSIDFLLRLMIMMALLKEDYSREYVCVCAGEGGNRKRGRFGTGYQLLDIINPVSSDIIEKEA